MKYTAVRKSVVQRQNWRVTMRAGGCFAGYDRGRGHFPVREHHVQHNVRSYTLLPEAPRVLYELDQTTITPQICSVDHEQNLWTTDRYGDYKELMTQEGVVVVYTSHNETGWAYVRIVHDGRNDRMRWL